jgi:molybdopterin converting factor small subunit
MRVVINMFGVDVRIKQEIRLEPLCPILRDVVKGLKALDLEHLGRFINDEILPVDGSIILVNGRNFLSLGGWETPIREGDEITFMVPVAGG